VSIHSRPSIPGSSHSTQRPQIQDGATMFEMMTMRIFDCLETLCERFWTVELEGDGREQNAVDLNMECFPCQPERNVQLVSVVIRWQIRRDFEDVDTHVGVWLRKGCEIWLVE